MTEAFFGLAKRPFLSTPTLERYFAGAAIEEAFATVQRVVERAEGTMAVFGGHGLGKSTLALRVADCFRKSYEIVHLNSSKICTRRALLQSLLFELRMPYREMSEGELRLSLLDRIQHSVDNPSHGLVLIVDEAQTMDHKLLEELRLITNLARNGEPRVRLVLLGTMRLEELLGHPQLEALNQRVAARCYLAPMNADETARYVKHKVELFGAKSSDLFDDDAIAALHRASDGIPRLIDQLADLALVMAANAKVKPVSSKLVEQAWADIQQLPTPWSEPKSTLINESANVEFGALEDDSSEGRAFESLRTDCEADKNVNAICDAEDTEAFESEIGLEDFITQDVENEDLVSIPNHAFSMWSERTSDEEPNSSEEFPVARELERHIEDASQYAGPNDSFGKIRNDVHAAVDGSVPADGSVPETVDYIPAQTDALSPSGQPVEATQNSSFTDGLLSLPPENHRAEETPPHSGVSEADIHALSFQETIADCSNDNVTSDVSSLCVANGIENFESTTAFEVNDAYANLFGNDFDEEFTLPSQSRQVSAAEATPDSTEWNFDDRLTHSQNESNDVEYTGGASDQVAMSTTPEPVGNSGDAFAAKINQLEKNLEAEIHDLISSINMGAMTLDPNEPIDVPSPDSISSGQTEMVAEAMQDSVSTTEAPNRETQGRVQTAPSTKTNCDRAQILSFSGESNTIPTFDDRELLVVEDAFPTIRTDQNNRAVPPITAYAPSQYAQLFTKLRGS